MMLNFFRGEFNFEASTTASDLSNHKLFRADIHDLELVNLFHVTFDIANIPHLFGKANFRAILSIHENRDKIQRQTNQAYILTSFELCHHA